MPGHGRTLLERLYGASAPKNESGSRALLESVRRNLERILNARMGTAPGSPDYGLPPLSQFLFGSADSMSRLAALVERAIDQYEPRLRRVRVRQSQSDPASEYLTLNLDITGVLDDAQRARVQLRARITEERWMAIDLA
jgi:type VI secretion system protein